MKLSPALDLDFVMRGERSSNVDAPQTKSIYANIDQVAALQRVVSVFKDSEKLRRVGLVLDGEDVISSVLRETLIDGISIRLLEDLLSAIG
jgi:hypothetical protein